MLVNIQNAITLLIYPLLTSGLDTHTFERLRSGIDEYFAIKSDSQARYLDKCNTLLRATLLEGLCWTHANYSFSKPELQTEIMGKPRLSTPGLHFSVSNSRVHGAIALAGVPVGIDIEDRWDTPRADSNIPKECVGTPTLHTQKLAELRLWTMKECYLKAIGTGLLTNIDAVLISEANQTVGLTDVATDRWWIHQETREEFVIAVCSPQVMLIEHILLTHADTLACIEAHP